MSRAGTGQSNRLAFSVATTLSLATFTSCGNESTTGAVTRSTDEEHSPDTEALPHGGHFAELLDAASEPNASNDAAVFPLPSSPCAPAPELVTERANTRFPDPSEYHLPSAPQLDLGGPDPEFTWNDPHVLRVASEYWMYATATHNFDFPVRAYRLVSSDGERWHRDPEEPVLDPAPSGSWDGGGVETPAVVYFRNQYHLFYTGYAREVDDPAHSVLDYQIGHATSCDGVVWTRASMNSLLAPSGTTDDDPTNDWYAFVVAEPGPVVYRDQLLLYFTALGASATFETSLQVIGVVTSDDGEHWSAPELVLTPDQSQYPRILYPGPPIDGWVGYSTPNALAFNDQMHLFFDVAYDADEASWQQVRLHHALSNDGKGDWVHDAASFASAGDVPWAVDEIRSPHALIDGNSLRVYFAGHELDTVEPNHFAIGMMTAELTTR